MKKNVEQEDFVRFVPNIIFDFQVIFPTNNIKIISSSNYRMNINKRQLC